jgi:taurine dioxygenase
MRSNPLHPTTALTIQRGLVEHGLLVFRTKSPRSPEELLALAACFSKPEAFENCTKTLHAGFCELDGYPCIRQVGTGDGMVYNRLGYEWHMDATPLTVLHCRQAPKTGGETLFIDMGTLYESLSPELKQIADLSSAIYSTRHTAGGAPAAMDWVHGLRMNGTGTKVLRGSTSKKPGYVEKRSPSIPVTGRWGKKTTLQLMAKNLETLGGRSWEESQALADQMLLAGMEPKKVSRESDDLQFNERTDFGPNVLAYEWQDGDICLWSNAAVLHSTSPPLIYEGQSRMMWQIQLDAELLEDHPPSAGAYANNTTSLKVGQ